jgi:autotransporter-associated beta strand protein
MDAGSTLDLRNNNLTIYGLSSIADDTDLQPAVILGDTATTILTVVTDRDSAFGGQIIGSGSLVKAGSGTLTLSGNNTFTGATSVTGGTLQIDSIDALKGTRGVTLADETVLFYNNDTNEEWTIKSVTGTATSEIRLNAEDLNKYVVDRNMTAFQGIWGIDGNGGYTLTLSDLAQINATKLNLQNGAKLVIKDVLNSSYTMQVLRGGADSAVELDDGVILNLTGSAAFSGTLSGVDGVASSGSVVLNGATAASVFNFSGVKASLLQGGIDLRAGHLVVNAADTQMFGLTTAAGTVLELGPTGELDLQSGNLAGTISGNGSLTKSETGILTIAGANVNYTGEITIGGGTVIVSNANALGEGHVMMTDGRLDLTNAGGAVTLKDLESTGATAQIDLGATALTLDNSADDEFTGELRGSGAITKNGLGSFTLSGDNTNYRGTVTANSGTLILTSANALNNATGVVLANLAVLQINGGSDSIRINNLTTGQATVVDLLSDLTVTSGIVDGKITGSSDLTKDGIGTLVLSGDNTGFVGNVDIKAGTLQIDSELSLGERTTIHDISIAAGANLVFNNDKTGSENEWLLDATYFDITGAGNFRKQGAGWMRMEGEFAYTGTTYIDGGVLRLADGSSLVTGSIDISKDATLHINDGSTITTSIITGNGTLVMDSGNLNVNTDGKNITYNIKIAGFGEIHKQGEGVLTIANQNDDYIGKVFVEDGALKLGNDRALARADSITLVEDNSDGSSGEGRLIVGAGIHAVIDGLYSSTIDGTVSGDEDQPLAGTATRIDLGIAGNSLSVSRGDFSGVISGEGDLIKDNIGGKGTVDEDLRLILRSRNLYTGATFVNAGVLELRDANAINRSKTATIGGTGFLEFNVGLNGSEPIVSEPTCPALGPDSDVVWNYDGQIASAADGEGTVVKSGLGELILSGDNTNFSGKIKITEGRLTIEDRVAMGSATSVDLGTLHDVQAAVDINGDSVVDALDTVQVAGTLWVKHNDDWNFNTVLVGEGNFVKDGSGTMTIANANNYSGITTIHGGTLIAANQLALGKSKVVVDALGRLQLGADLALDNLGGTGDVLLSDINDQNAAGFTLTLNTTSTEGQVWMFDGHFLGTGSIVKMGRGEWIVGKSLEGNINLDVREGTLTITDPGLYSSTRTYAVANDATLGLMMTGTFDSTVTGAGGVLVRAMDVSKFDLTTLGCFGYGVTSLANLEYPVDLTDPTQLAEFRDALGVLTVTGTNTYTGRTIVDAGTLRMGNDAALGTSNVVELREFMTINGTTVESLGTLDLNGHSLTLGGLTGNGTVAFGVGNGGGTLTITGDGVGAQDMTYTGNLVGDTGTLKLDSSNPTPFTLAGIVTKTNSYGDAITPEFAGTMLVEKGELVLDRQVLSVDPVTHVPTYDAGSDVLAKADVKVNGSDASLVAAKNANNIIGDLTVDGGIVELKGSSDGVNLTATTLTLNSGSKLVFSNNLSTASTATLEIKERMTLNAGTVEVSAPVPVVNPSDLDALYSYLLATVDSGIIDGGVDKVKLAEKNYGTVADAGKVLALRDRPSGLVFGYRLAEVDNSGSTDLVLKAATILNSTVVNADLKPVVDALNETLVSDDRANMPDIVKLVANTSSLATKQTLDQIGEAFSPGVTAGAAVRVANDAAEALGGTIGGRTAKITPMATVVKKMSSNDRLSASTDDETAVMPTALATEESTIWGSAVASTAKYGSGITSARENTYGGVIGFEKTDGQTTIGFFVSGLTSDVKGDMGEKVDMNGLYVGTYAARDGGLFFADGNLMAGHIWSDTTREGKIVAGSTTDSYSAEGEYGTNMASAFGEIGMKFEVDPWYYRGALGLKYTYVNSEGYTEDTANGDYALDIGSITKNSLAASLDLRAGRRFNTSWGTTGSAEFRVGYIQELLGTSVSTDVAMAGMPNSSYSHDGAGLSSGKFILGFDYGVGLNDQLTLKAGVLAEVGTDSYNRISGNLKLDWVF